MLAALAPTTESGGANLSDIAYLDALYGLGARAWFDIVAAQPYGFSQPPDAPAQPSALNFGRAALLRQVMVRHGDAATPLWATAFGWNIVEGSPWGSVGEAEQAGLRRPRRWRRPARRSRGWGRSSGLRSARSGPPVIPGSASRSAPPAAARGRSGAR